MPSTYRLVLANAVIFISLHRLYCHSFVFVLHLRLIPHARIFDFFFLFIFVTLKIATLVTGWPHQFLLVQTTLISTPLVWIYVILAVSGVCVCLTFLQLSSLLSLFIALQSLKWRPYTLCITALRYSTHSWLIMFILLTHWVRVCVCVYVCVRVLTVWLLFWMRLHEFLIPSAICADAVTKAHGKCSLGGYPLLPMCLEAPVSQHVIVNHNHRGGGRDTCIALFISTSHPLFFLLFIMLFS